MKRIPLIIMILILGVFLAGCIRTTTVVKERLDQKLKGNRGYIRGNIPPSIKEKEKASTRTMIQVEVELPPYEGWEQYKKEDKEIWGNKGVVVGESRIKPAFSQETPPISEEAPPLPKRKYTK